MALAFLPNYAGTASAETYGVPDSTVTADASLTPAPDPTFTDPQTPAPTDQPTDPPTAAPTDQPTPEPSVEPSVDPASPVPTELPSSEPTATPSIPPIPDPSVLIELTSDPVAIGGIVSVVPGATLTLNASVSTAAALEGAKLLIDVPAGWTVTDAGDGVHDTSAATVSWSLEPLPEGGATSRGMTLRAPDLASGSVAAPASFGVRVEIGTSIVIGPVLDVFVVAPVSVSRVTLGRVPGPVAVASYLAPGEPLRDEPRYEVFRISFDVLNADTAEYRWTPTLEFASAAEGPFRTLPAGSDAIGVAFYAAPEWIRAVDGGTEIGPALETTPAAGDSPARWRSMGTNPIPSVVLSPSSSSIVEFSVRATVDAEYSGDYFFRLTDAGVPFDGAPVANVVLEPLPPTELSPGQRPGVPAGTAARGPTRFGLNLPNENPGYATSAAIHGPSYSLTSDACAACHRAHTAPGTLVTASPTQLALCSSCHNGVDAPAVASAYVGVPANDPSARAYYQHEPTNSCSECHNPHDSSSTPSAPGPQGWTASGAVAGASGVAATNGPGAVSYALVTKTALEYQLCFKCHSGYATLPSNDGQPLSRQALDKGIEFDPRNASYHPIEAAGTNGSDAMAASLAGTSPYKLWNFNPTSTIRCVNCHSDPRLVADAVAAGQPLAADATLPVHASTQRGILIASYRDRTLKGPLDLYQAADFALCFVCHAEAPFRDTTGALRRDTNFRFHGLHVSGRALINHGSNGTNIDLPDDGGGLATCAECHFRIHSSAYPVNGQPSWPRLVDFAPNVSGGLTTANWSPKSTEQLGTCALKCHGQPHSTTY